MLGAASSVASSVPRVSLVSINHVVIFMNLGVPHGDVITYNIPEHWHGVPESNK